MNVFLNTHFYAGPFTSYSRPKYFFAFPLYYHFPKGLNSPRFLLPSPFLFQQILARHLTFCQDVSSGKTTYDNLVSRKPILLLQVPTETKLRHPTINQRTFAKNIQSLYSKATPLLDQYIYEALLKCLTKHLLHL